MSTDNRRSPRLLTGSYWLYARKIGLRATDPLRAVGVLRDYQISVADYSPEESFLRIASARRKLAKMAMGQS